MGNFMALNMYNQQLQGYYQQAALNYNLYLNQVTNQQQQDLIDAEVRYKNMLAEVSTRKLNDPQLVIKHIPPTNIAWLNNRINEVSFKL